MSIRKHPTKKGCWYIVIEGKFLNKKGKEVRQKYIKFEGSEAEALAIDAELNNRPVEPQYPSVLDILPRFLSAYQNNTRPNTYSAMEQALKHLLPYYGEMRIPLISNHHHEEYKSRRLAETYLPGKHGQRPEDDTKEEADRRKHPSKNSINRELACLKALLTYAKEEKITVGSTPTVFEKRHCGKKAIVPLAPSQLMALVNVLTGPQAICIELMIYTGMRVNEATGMKCDDIHLENSTMYVTGKGGETQLVPIPDPLLPRIRAVMDGRDKGWLSVNPKTGEPFGDITKRLNSFCRQAKIKKSITHHTLRHSCATALILAGVDLPKVQAILRHESIETTMLYVHVAASFGNSKESLIAKKLYGLDKQEEDSNKAGVICVTELSSKGPLYADVETRAYRS